ncbi:MAG: MBL fold metallo-hydrolase [Pseudomonadota bacterium]
MRYIPCLSLLALTTAATAQPTDVTITPENVAPGVDVLFGQGGNIGVSHGEDGTILIDDQFAPLTPKIQAAVAALGATPVKFLINTHWHGDHTGGNENYGKIGALIMAHDNVRVRMATPQTRGDRTTPASPKVALPVVTYHDGLSLHLNGDEVRTYHMHDAHTDGDSIVIWKKANVVHMGDLYFNKISLPFVDLNSGGSVKGMLAAIEKTLALINPQTKIIPGHGPMASHGDLVGYRDMLKSIIGAVQAGIAAGKGVDQIKALKPAAKWEVPGGFISGDAFVEMAYKSLTTPGKPAHVMPDNHVH